MKCLIDTNNHKTRLGKIAKWVDKWGNECKPSILVTLFALTHSHEFENWNATKLQNDSFIWKKCNDDNARSFLQKWKSAKSGISWEKWGDAHCTWEGWGKSEPAMQGVEERKFRGEIVSANLVLRYSVQTAATVR